MTGFLTDHMAPIMFGALILTLVLGFPVAFTLAANGLLFAWVGIELGLLTPALLQAIPERVLGIMRNETLLAIPFFTFMGLILERSGMAEDLLETIGQLFGPIRGGLAYAVIFVGALLAATTGIVAASVIAMGLISLPAMQRHGYDRRLASGVIVASGTLAQIIPPSLVLIVLGDQLGRSVGDMYTAALMPGLILAGLYALYVLVWSLIDPKVAPALAPEARSLRGAALLRATLVSLVPPLILILLVLGTIFLGVATPTEGGAMGAVGAVVLAIARNRLSISLLQEASGRTLLISTFVMFVLVGSTVFGLSFRALNGDIWVADLLAGLPGGQLGFLIVANILIFVLAFFLDFFELAFIIIPILGPVAEKLGIDLVWFGVLIGINMQTSFMHPPFGFALFYLWTVVRKEDYTDQITKRPIRAVRLVDIYWGAAPFVLIQLLMCALVIAFPSLVQRPGARIPAGIGLDPVIEIPLYDAPAPDLPPS